MRSALGPTQPPIQWVPAFSAGSKAIGAWSNHSPPSVAEVKNEWRYTSTPTIWTSCHGQGRLNSFYIDGCQTFFLFLILALLSLLAFEDDVFKPASIIRRFPIYFLFGQGVDCHVLPLHISLYVYIFELSYIHVVSRDCCAVITVLQQKETHFQCIGRCGMD
jgi:hypothetical protein